MTGPKTTDAATPAAPKPPARVRTVWAGEKRFDSGRPGGPTARFDGAAETGQSPVDGVLSALASCVSIDVVEILAKRRTPVASLAVDVVGERVDSTPRRLRSITLAFQITGDGIEREHAERAIDLSITRYCSVRDSLAKDIAIDWSLTLG